MWLVEGHIGTRQKGIYRVRASHELARVSVSYDEANLVSAAGLLTDGYVAVRGETIAAIGQGEPPPAAETVDHSGKLILPGLVDGNMHTSSSMGWPGIEGSTRRPWL